ncbi:MAG: rhodanese-like domain-containing protein [Deltaproteobacteria bacterium]|nr:rhodanese-like domain-containing protein [Deltaproteobacteria bacterium]
MNQIEFYELKLAFEIDSWDLNELLNKGNVMVIDARRAEAFRREHIPGAVNMPHREMSRQTITQLSSDQLHVTYCDGIGCNGSTRGALNLARLGCTVKELLGGLDWWKRDGYPTEGTGTSEEHVLTCGC